MFSERHDDGSPSVHPHNTHHQYSMKTLNRTLLALALAGATLTAIAQDDRRPQPPGGPNGGSNRGPGGPGDGRPRMASPLMEALDTNHDGTLDAGEIKNAAVALLKLDKNGDGKLTQEELRPARPPGGRGGPGGPGGPEGQNREGRPRGEGRPPRPDRE